MFLAEEVEELIVQVEGVEENMMQMREPKTK